MTEKAPPDIGSVLTGEWKPRSHDGTIVGAIQTLEDEVELLTLALTEVYKQYRADLDVNRLELVERALNWVNRG